MNKKQLIFKIPMWIIMTLILVILSPLVIITFLMNLGEWVSINGKEDKYIKLFPILKQDFDLFFGE